MVGSLIKGGLSIRSNLPTDKLRKRSISQKPEKIQERVLKRLLARSANTAIGEAYSFDKILKSGNIVNSFRQAVPVHDYSAMYQQWWYRCLNGEPFVCWPGKIKYFALSSGTSEASSKYIPVTRAMMTAMRKTSIRQLLTLDHYDFPPEFFKKSALMLGGSTHLQYNGTYYAGDISGINSSSIPFWFQHYYKPGNRISKERDWQTKLEEIIKKAPKWDIGVIVGVPAWFQILLEKIIERYNLKTIHDIWPNLSVFVHGGVSFTPYKKSFEALLSKPLHYMETYLASEGFIAYQSRPDVNSMELVIDNGIFFEFIPFEKEYFDQDYNVKPNPPTLTIGEVEEGREYALLMTTCAGAYRYLIGDTVRFTSLKHRELQITGRTKHFLSLCGEHLSVDNMTRAVKMLQDEMNVGIREFTVIGYKRDKASMFAHKWYLGTEKPMDSRLAAEKLDGYLKALNDDYRVERLEAIKEVTVEVLPVDVFYNWMRKKGREGSQNKFPRVLKGASVAEWQDFIRGAERY